MLYRLFRFLFLIIIKTFNRFQVIGKENIPLSGPVILVSNHISNWDPMVFGNSIKRQVHFIAKEELFKIPLIKHLMVAWGTIPVKRGRGDRETITKSLEILQQGKIIGVFIEGTRNKTNPDQIKPQPGAAMLAIKSGAAVIPLYLHNTNKIGRTFQKVRVFIGPPLKFQAEPGLDKKELYDKIGKQITAAILDLRPIKKA